MKKTTFLSTFSAAFLFCSTGQVTAQQLDPQMRAVLQELAGLNGKPIETLSPEEARRQPTPADALSRVFREQDEPVLPEPVGTVENKIIALGGERIPIRIYTPVGKGPFPVILYVHGGGWVIGNLDTYDATPRALCNATPAVVVSAHYRQAPAHKFPAAHEDVFEIYRWTVANENRRNYDPARIAVVGESAGGNMAAAISMMAKARGVQLPVHQVLVYPVADLTKMDTPSYREHADAKPLNAAMMGWFAKHALASDDDARNPYASPVLAGDLLKIMPSTTLILAQIDPLRSEGERLGDLLRAAGVRVNQKTYEGVTHEFFGMAKVVDKARDAIRLAATDLRAAFGVEPVVVNEVIKTEGVR